MRGERCLENKGCPFKKEWDVAERPLGSVSADRLLSVPLQRSQETYVALQNPIQQAHMEFTRSEPLLQLLTKEGLTPPGPHPGPSEHWVV